MLPRRTALVLVPALFAAPAAWAKDAESTRRACVLTSHDHRDEQSSEHASLEAVSVSQSTM